jgi:16S rRNA (cytosine967-C5)-methyltransferase
VAGIELLEGAGEAADAAGHTAKVVHHAVAQAKHLASPAEARLVNAVLRKLGAALAEAGGGESAPAGARARAEFYSHPVWLVARWTKQFGEEAARRLLEWNQTPAPVYARWRAPGEAPPAELFAATAWADFYEVKSGHWPDVERLLADGKIYLQDPAARLAVELLAPQAGETALDLCASPGGKSLLIADALAAAAAPAGTAPAGRVVAVDLPGARLERLKENLARVRGAEAVLAPGDVRQPGGFLREGDIGRHARQQAELLAAAARLVAPGGRLVYSTCSLEAEENENVVAAFLRGPGREFSREAQVWSRPWETGHDGAGAFRLRRAG